MFVWMSDKLVGGEGVNCKPIANKITCERDNLKSLRFKMLAPWALVAGTAGVSVVVGSSVVVGVVLAVVIWGARNGSDENPGRAYWSVTRMKVAYSVRC